MLRGDAYAELHRGVDNVHHKKAKSAGCKIASWQAKILFKLRQLGTMIQLRKVSWDRVSNIFLQKT